MRDCTSLVVRWPQDTVRLGGNEVLFISCVCAFSSLVRNPVHRKEVQGRSDWTPWGLVASKERLRPAENGVWAKPQVEWADRYRRSGLRTNSRPCPLILSLALSLSSATSTKWRPWSLFTASTVTASYAGYFYFWLLYVIFLVILEPFLLAFSELQINQT